MRRGTGFTANEKGKEKRKKWIDKGLCSNCGGEKKREGMYCEKCIIKSRKCWKERTQKSGGAKE